MWVGWRFFVKRVPAAERHGGDGAGRIIGRVHAVLLRREKAQGVGHITQVGGDQFLP